MRKVKYYSAKLKRVETYTEVELQRQGQGGDTEVKLRRKGQGEEQFVERAPWEQA